MVFQPIRIGSLTCTPLHPTFGAEISGVDFSTLTATTTTTGRRPTLPKHIINDIIAAQNKFGVTVYRNTGLTDQSHVAFSYQLGELEMCPKLGGPNQPPRFSEPELFDAGNMNRDGGIIGKGTRRWWYKYAFFPLVFVGIEIFFFK